MEFHDRLRELRKNTGYTQEELAKLLGISAGAVGLYEQNRREPDNDTVKKLATIFNVSIDYILGFENNTPSTTLSYSGNAEKQEISQLMDKILKNTDDGAKLKQIKMFLDTYVK